MFAVPGWSVSSSDLKRQTHEVIDYAEPGIATASSAAAAATVPGKNKGKHDHDSDLDDGVQPKRPRKRSKRHADRDQAAAVTADNVAELWEKYIERRDVAGGNNGDAVKASSTKKPRRARKTCEAESHGPREGQNTVQEGREVQEADTDAKGQRAHRRHHHHPDERQQDQGGRPEHDGARKKRRNRKAPEAPSEEKAASPRRLPVAARQMPSSSLTIGSGGGDGGGTAADDTAAVPGHAPTTAGTAAEVAAPGGTAVKLTPLQASMRQKLTAARFRHLNQSLYTASSAESLRLFRENPELFEQYHEGFRTQVAAWPENPVDGYVREIEQRGALGADPKKLAAAAANKRGKKRSSTAAAAAAAATTTKADDAGGAGGAGDDIGGGGGSPAAAAAAAWQRQLQSPLPRTAGICTIADLGCGDARLARALAAPRCAPLRVRVLSFDLRSASALVTAADIARLPLAAGSVDVAVFCLALMGTNWPDFVREAHRVLRWKGELWVAEIKSRFAAASRGAGADDGDDDGGGGGGGGGGVGLKNQKKKMKRKDKDSKRAGGGGGGEDDVDVGTAAADIYAEDRDAGAAHSSGAAATAYLNPFIAVLRRHGFALYPPNDASSSIDNSNKMFVKMRFIKASASQAVRGDDDAGVAAAAANDEAAVLKPCVYKLR